MKSILNIFNTIFMLLMINRRENIKIDLIGFIKNLIIYNKDK